MVFKNREQLVNNGSTDKIRKKRSDVLEILESVVESVNPYNAVISKCKEHKILLDSEEIDSKDFNDIFVVGFGKASIGMIQAAVDALQIKQGIAVTNDSEGLIMGDQIEVIVGGHPLPNNGSVLGTEKILDLIHQCKSDDLLLVMISGGGSALLCKPRVSLEDLQVTTNLLLKSGADISEINTIRKHLSFVKGGQLTKQANCKVISFIISDIIDDPIEFIASGPTSPDSTTFKDAEEVLAKYDIWKKIPNEVKKVIKDGINGKISETPKKDDSFCNKITNEIVANNKVACNAAVNKAELLGYNPLFLTSSLTGEAKDIGKYLIKKAKSYINDENRIFITGGESTVTIQGEGKGGRNQEMVLGAIEKLAETEMVFASFATDGCDGTSDAAGAIIDGDSYLKAKKKNLKYTDYLKDNNSYEFFKHLNDLFITGPTGTNVMDIQIVVV